MEIKINKEIREYKENIVLGLNLRQFVFSVGAIACSAGSYFLLKDIIGKEAVSWVCIATAVPMACFGFFNSNGLSLEQYLFAVITTEWILPAKRIFETPEKKQQRLAQNKKKKHPPKKKKQPTKKRKKGKSACSNRSKH